MQTTFGFTPTVTTSEMRENKMTKAKFEAINELRKAEGKDPVEFDYLLLCNKICGNSHYNMQMKIVVEEEADFNAWIKEQKTIAQLVTNEQK